MDWFSRDDRALKKRFPHANFIGDIMSSIFGGGNDYQFVMPPTVGAPRREGETDEQYLGRLYDEYQAQNQQYQSSINQAMNRSSIPQNLLNFSAANKTAQQQGLLAQMLRKEAGSNFGTGANMAQQQGLIDQILAQGRGEGPNPALDQLRMTTDQNARQGAAMAASQRGVNPALAARLAAQGTASANQQAAGQAALQSAQQQLGAQQLGGSLLGQAVNQRLQQAQQRSVYAQLLAGALGQQRAQDIGQTTAQGQAGLNLMTANTNTEALRRQAQLAWQQQMNNAFNSMNATNAGVASQNAATNFQFGQGAMSGLSSAIGGGLGMAEGGEVPDLFKGAIAKKMYDGGMAEFMSYQQDPMSAMYSQLARSGSAIERAGQKGGESVAGISSGLANKLARSFEPTGGPTGAIPISDVDASLLGGPTMALASDGGKIPGRAAVRGDSESNDTVPVLLSPGEIVIPRSATTSLDKAQAFLAEVMREHRGPDYDDVERARQNYEKMACGGRYMAEGGKVEKPPKKESKPWWERILEPSADKSKEMRDAEIWGHLQPVR